MDANIGTRVKTEAGLMSEPVGEDTGVSGDLGNMDRQGRR